ncbi:MAG: FecR domain-containing protein [Spirochaetaceae bacterium]|nr:FecR domain-containing protein [Spirochaetaceae bacterium]
MKRSRIFAFLALAAGLLVGAASAPPAASEVSPDDEDPIATIEYLDGPVTITRDGRTIADPFIGDDVYDEDLFRTGSGGSVVIALGGATGMRGNITVAQKSAFYLRLAGSGDKTKSQAELVAGQLALKVKKIAGSPELEVLAADTVAGVRGTEFTVTSSAGGAVLVSCVEGEVACVVDGDSLSALPGQAVERREGARLRRMAVAAGEDENFRRRWADDEAAAFKRDAPKAARTIATRYLELSERLAGIHKELAASGVLRRWAEEREAALSRRPPRNPRGAAPGTPPGSAQGPAPAGPPSGGSPAKPGATPGAKPGGGAATRAPQRPDLATLGKEVREVAPLLRESAAILGKLERMNAAVDELEKALAGEEAILSEEVRKGLTVRDFFKRFETGRERLDRDIAWLRQAGKMLKQRSAFLAKAGKKP